MDSEFTPEELADELFSYAPLEECSFHMQQDMDTTDTYLIFEILLTTYLEGIIRFEKKLTRELLQNITTEYLESLNPWFKSIFFKININKYEYKNKEDYSGYYCKIMLRCLDEVFFEMKSLEKDYHFILKGCVIDVLRSIQDITQIDLFRGILEVGNDVYEISFSYYIKPSLCSK